MLRWVNEFTRWYTKPAEARLKRQCVSTHFVYQSGVLTLGVLCVKGMIQSAWEVQEPGPARRVYSLTEPGRAEFARRIEAWESYSAAINAVLNPRRESYG